jgi:hypothetical protein
MLTFESVIFLRILKRYLLRALTFQKMRALTVERVNFLKS